MTATPAWCSSILAVALALAGRPAIAAAPDDAEPDATTDAHADDDRQAASTHFRRGVTLYDAGDPAGAVLEFERAYELAPHYGLLYNLGIAQADTGQAAAATRSLRRYLAEGGDEVDAAHRRAVDKRLVELEASIGTLAVDPGVDGAVLIVDGIAQGTVPLAEDLVLDVGRHVLVVHADDHEPWTREIEVRAGERTMLSPDLPVAVVEPDPAPGPEPAPAPTRAPGSEPPPAPVTDAPPPAEAVGSADTHLRRATWAMLGLTAGVSVAAAVTGGLTVRTDGELDRELGLAPADAATIATLTDRRHSLAAATDGLIGCAAVLGAAALGLGVTLLVKRRRQGSRAARRPGVPRFGLFAHQ